MLRAARSDSRQRSSFFWAELENNRSKSRRGNKGLSWLSTTLTQSWSPFQTLFFEEMRVVWLGYNRRKKPIWSKSRDENEMRASDGLELWPDGHEKAAEEFWENGGKIFCQVYRQVMLDLVYRRRRFVHVGESKHFQKHPYTKVEHAAERFA